MHSLSALWELNASRASLAWPMLLERPDDRIHQSGPIGSDQVQSPSNRCIAGNPTCLSSENAVRPGSEWKFSLNRWWSQSA